MVKRPRYSSYIKDMPYLLLEMRKAAKLLVAGKTSDEIVRLSIDENIFQLTKERRRRALAQRVVLRLNAVSASIVELIAHGDDISSKLGALYAILKTDLLFFEFMHVVYRDKVEIGYETMRKSEISDFLRAKACDDEYMRNWQTDNLIRVKNAYINVLAEAGLLEKKGAELAVRPPIMIDDFQAALGDWDEYSRAMGMGVRY